MNKLFSFLFALVLVAVLSYSVFAATPFVTTVTLAGAGDNGTFTNTTPYYAFQIHRMECYSWDQATDTVTVRRIRSSRTNTIGTITITSNAGVLTNCTDQYFFENDVFVFDPTSTNGGGTVEMQNVQAN